MGSDGIGSPIGWGEYLGLGPKESIRTISILSLIFMYSNYPQFAPSRVLWVSTTTSAREQSDGAHEKRHRDALKRRF